MPIYMIQAGQDGPVKIGFAENVLGRLNKIQADNFETVQAIRVVTGGQTEEEILHRRFEQFHIRGEWFHFHPSMMEALEGAEDLPVPKIREVVGRPPLGIGRSHAEVIERMGGQTKLAKVLGLPLNRTSHWKERGIPLKYWRPLEKTSVARAHGITADLLENLPVNTKGTDQ